MKIVFWLLVAVALVYAFYSGAMAIWSHLEVQGIVEEVVAERARADRFDRAARVKEDILKRAAASGIVLDDRETRVTDEGRLFTVLVRWPWPVIAWGGDVVLAIPLKHERAFELPERR